uniref:Uncharacterized protein n=1 Tax=Salix viminalis TaxID=40686 RepID=A0A6N2MS04_SALVM
MVYCIGFIKSFSAEAEPRDKTPELRKRRGLSEKAFIFGFKGGEEHDNSNNISIDDALASFYRMVRMNPRPSVVEFGKFLGSFAKKKQYSTVVSLCNQMDLLGVTHNMFKLGIQPNAITFNALTNGFCNEGKIKDAKYGCSSVQEDGTKWGKPNVQLCKDRLVNDAMEFLSEMLDRGIQPDVVTYNSIVHGFCNLGQLNEATRLFKEMVGKDVMTDTVTFNILVDGLCKEGMVSEARCGKIKDAVELFNEMVRRGHEPNVINYNTLINGLCKTGNTSMAVHVFKKMEQHGCKPDVVTYSTIIDNLCKHRLVNDAMESYLKCWIGAFNKCSYLQLHSPWFCNLGQLNEATRLFKEMVGKDVMPDTVTFTILVDGLCKEGMVSEARRVFETMPEKGVEPNVYTYNALMDGYNILINGYCKSRRMEEAKSLLAEMSHKALPPDTVCHLQHSYARFDDLLDFARWLLQTWAFGRGIKTAQGNAREETRTNIVLYNILIEDVVTYNSIVHGFCNLGQLNEATRLFKEMASRDVMPNTVTFTILVDGLCKEGMVSEARRVFETMTEKGPYDKARNAVALALSPVVRALIDPDGALRDIRDLDSISFSDWFLSKGGTRMSIQRMWDPVAYALGFIDCDNISARCMLTIFSLFPTFS